MGMTSQDGELVSILPVPNADSLVITRADNPWQLDMELDSADVVHVACKREETFLDFVVPDFDQMIITS